MLLISSSSYFQTCNGAGKLHRLLNSTLLSQYFQPTATSMETVSVAKKNVPPPATPSATTVNKKRPRRVIPKKPKPESESEEDQPPPVAETADIEDFNFSRDEVVEIRASLLKWYDCNQRDLPWRRISNGVEGEKEDDGDGSDRRAYAVWVSEVMLQQTRVQTVIDYFNRWMEKWPTLHHLASASIEEVNEMWAGLGYYRRARFLLEGAKMIAEEGCTFPKTVATLLRVPGIGAYTAGAIASIAFKEAVPVVDGNVVRVTARLKAISANPKDAKTVKTIWKLAGQLVDVSRPGDFNQALMDLGATICTPSNPSCSSCPISTHCRAIYLSRQNRSALVTDYPIKVVKAKQRHDFSAVSVVEILEDQDVVKEELQCQGKFLIVKRPDGGLLAGLWEFPSVLVGEEADLTSRRQAIDQFLIKSFNLDVGKSCDIVSREEIGEYTHIFSHIRLRMFVELLILRPQGGMGALHEKEKCSSLTWKSVDSEELSSMGLSSGVRKVYSMIEKFKLNKSKSNPKNVAMLNYRRCSVT